MQIKTIMKSKNKNIKDSFRKFSPMFDNQGNLWYNGDVIKLKLCIGTSENIWRFHYGRREYKQPKYRKY